MSIKWFKGAMPKIGRSTVAMFRNFYIAGKVFYIDAILTIISIGSIIWWLFDDTVSIEGAAAILFVYAYFNTLGKYVNKCTIEKYEKLLNNNNISFKD